MKRLLTIQLLLWVSMGCSRTIPSESSFAEQINKESIPQKSIATAEDLKATTPVPQLSTVIDSLLFGADIATSFTSYEFGTIKVIRESDAAIFSRPRIRHVKMPLSEMLRTHRLQFTIMPNDGEPVANATAILEQRRPLNRPWEYAMTQSYVDGIESLQSSLDTLQVFELNGVPLKKDEIVNRLVDTHRAVLVDGRIDPFYYSFLKPDVLLVADQGWTKPLLELRDKPPTVMRRQIATRGQE